MKADNKGREKVKNIVMSPTRLIFVITRHMCFMKIGSPSQMAEVHFRVVAEQISTRDLVIVDAARSSMRYDNLIEWRSRR
jgi:hypothetical protein